MKTIVAGLSAHVRSKIIPSLEAANGWTFAGAVTSSPEQADLGAELAIVSSLADLPACAADVLYVATPIGLHYELILEGLNRGLHVISEKVIVRTSAELDSLYRAADRAQRRVLEVRMYQHHEQFRELSQALESGRWRGQSLGDLQCLTSRFTIPALDPKNFRYDRSLGGGAIYDVGFYPISSVLTLIPKFRILGHEVEQLREHNVDGSGKLLATTPHGASVEAEWAIGRDYANFIEASFEAGTLHLERAFSKPIGFAATTGFRHDDEEEFFNYPEANHFASMFEAYAPLLTGAEEDYDRHRAEVARTVALIEQIAAA